LARPPKKTLLRSSISSIGNQTLLLADPKSGALAAVAPCRPVAPPADSQAIAEEAREIGSNPDANIKPDIIMRPGSVFHKPRSPKSRSPMSARFKSVTPSGVMKHFKLCLLNGVAKLSLRRLANRDSVGLRQDQHERAMRGRRATTRSVSSMVLISTGGAARPSGSGRSRLG